MKKLITLLFAMVAFAVSAQLTATGNLSNSIKMKTAAGVDSAIVTNSGSGSISVTFTQKKAESIQLLVTKTSGTLGGTATLYGSNDGVNWTALTDATSTPTVTAYTVTDAGTYAAPQAKFWSLVSHDFRAYQITWVGTGTMAGRMKAMVKYN
jgi:hypothetical protein